MLDYSAIRAVAAVVQTGAFDKAASLLNVTPSAISQRVKQLEERLGVVLIVRGTPCRATEKGEWLCRHVENVSLLEADLFKDLPDLLGPGEAAPRVTLHIATNADSLGTWFLPAIAEFAKSSDFLLDVAVDDEDHTVEWLERGRVVAAVTSAEKPVQGCRRTALGSLRYHATASPAYIEQHFGSGVALEAFRCAPTLTFNHKDSMQTRWVRNVFGETIAPPTHWLPSTQGFVEACLCGMGWAMNPAVLVEDHIRSGHLVDLVPETPLDIPLYWQINRFAADRLTDLTRAVMAGAERMLVR